MSESETKTISTEEILSGATEKRNTYLHKRPAPAYDLRLRKKRKKKPTDPDDPDDDNPDDETDDTAPDDDDDDDDGTTGSGTKDDESGEGEDENELKQLGLQPKQSQQEFLKQIQSIQQKNTQKENPKGPEKTERSPWQQMVDFFVHGVKGAQIKNGDISAKPNLVDRLLLGMGFKGFKKDILLQEQAQMYWSQKARGQKADMRLLNTDFVDKKIKADEKKEQQPLRRALYEKSLLQQQEQITRQRLEQRFAEQIKNENSRMQSVQLSREQVVLNQQLSADKTKRTLAESDSLRVAQNELTAQGHANVFLRGKEQKVPTEIMRSDNTRVDETGAKNVQTVSAEQTKQQMQERIRTDNKTNLEAQQIMAQQQAAAQSATANATLGLSATATAAMAAHAATNLRNMIEQARQGLPHGPIRPRPQDIERDYQHIAQYRSESQKPFNAESIADRIIHQQGGVEQLSARVNQIRPLGERVENVSSGQQNNATLSHAGQVHQEKTPEEVNQSEGRS